MATFLCVADVHEDEQKLEKIVEFSKGCDAILDAGDDLDRFVNNSDESAAIIRNICREFSNMIPSQRRTLVMKDAFRKVYEDKAVKINDYYRRAGIPVFATLGNHDPSFVVSRMSAVNYIHGKYTDFMGLTLAGLPATGEFVRMVMDFCPEYYPHINWYDRVESDRTAKEPSNAAKNILGSSKVDVFVTHKAFRPEFHSWGSRPGLRSCDYAYRNGIDAGALTVYRKFKPRLNIFGHYHMSEPRSTMIEGRMFLGPGVNYAVKVAMNEGMPEIIEALKYT
jgi:Icc-related predicted phosphoesterase